jgi:hypothetical protein
MTGPAETLNYLIAGYAVIFGFLLLYLVSVVVRFRSLRREEQTLIELLEDEQPQ